MKHKHKKCRNKKNKPTVNLSYTKYGSLNTDNGNYDSLSYDINEKELYSILINIEAEDINFSLHSFNRGEERHISKDDVIDTILNKMPLYIDKSDIRNNFKLVYLSYKDSNELVIVISALKHQKILIKTVYEKEIP